MDVITKDDTKAHLLVITERGIGKKSSIDAWPMQLRGGVGVKAASLTEKTGLIVAAQILTKEDEAMILTSQKGQVMRTGLKSVPRLTRDTQGVILMRLSQEDKIAAATIVAKRRDEEKAIITEITEQKNEDAEQTSVRSSKRSVSSAVARKTKVKASKIE